MARERICEAMMTPAQAIERVADYIEANAGRLHDWVPEDRATLVQALGFHALNGTIRVEWKAESRKLKAEMEVAGVAIVWPDWRAEIERLDAAKQSIFRWTRVPDGDCLYLGLVITTAPGVLHRLGAWFHARWPGRPQLAHRRGKLVELDWLTRLSKAESRKQKAEIYGQES